MSLLCQHCCQINFDTLRGPTAEDLAVITSDSNHDGLVRLAQAQDGASFDKVHLGSLSRIRASASTCQLCSLFMDVIHRQGGMYRDSNGEHSVDRDDIYFRADPDMSYFARIIPQSGTQEQSKSFVLRRLCLTALEQDTDNNVVYIDHAFQLCHVGELNKQIDLYRNDDSMPFAGRKRTSLIMISRITDWIQICLKEHGSLCLPDKNTPKIEMKTFRLIDVHRKCIIELHNVNISDLRFMALSYVWGGTQFFQLTSNTLEQLKIQGALDHIDLPKTIADSMELARRLEFSYLWVDGFCIIQNRMEDKAYQISHMTDIYSLSFLTIVAASGVDANAGLAGLNRPREVEQREVVIIPPSENTEGLSILNCLKSYPHYFDEFYTRGRESVDLAKWAHRGWTLQETALPNRKLIFTDEQVFWSCHGAYFCEESHFEIPKVKVKHFLNSVHKLNLHALANDAVDPWIIYDELVSDFTRRDLTYDGDVESAFAAVMASFEKRTGSTFLFGIPRTLFELGLMWETSHGITRRNGISTLPMVSSGERTAFPTWSWMGWKGESSCRVTVVRREIESTTVVCFSHRRNPLRLQHVAQLDRSGPHQSHLHDQEDIQLTAVSLEDIKVHIPTLREDYLRQYPDEQLLFFWTHSATFAIEHASTAAPISIKEYREMSIPRVVDPQGREVGTVCRIRTEDPASSTPKHIAAEFIQVGLRRDPDIPEEILPPQALVLHIVRDELGITRRVNYGGIELSAWEDASPQRCLVALG